MSVSRPIAALTGALLLIGAAAPAAMAVDSDYPPAIPTKAAGVCRGDIPFLAYSVDFGDQGAFAGRPMTITFVNPGGPDYVIDTTVPQPGVEQEVLWPGASVSPPDWPGWVLDADGQWVESTTDTGAFTRAPGGVEVRFETNPTLTTNVVYPPATSACANPKNVKPSGGVPPSRSGGVPTGPVAGAAASIPSTGGTLLPALLGGAAVVLGGGLFVASRRRRG